jgi:hypothetical protein
MVLNDVSGQAIDPISKGQESVTFEDGTEIVSNYHYSLRNIQKSAVLGLVDWDLFTVLVTWPLLN